MAEVLPSLPNAGALVFEILPEHLGNIGLDGIHRELETLKRLWNTRAPAQVLVRQRHHRRSRPPSSTPPKHVRGSNGSSGSRRRRRRCAGSRSWLRRAEAVDPRCAQREPDARGALQRSRRSLPASVRTPRSSLLSVYFRSVPADAFVAIEAAPLRALPGEPTGYRRRRTLPRPGAGLRGRRCWPRPWTAQARNWSGRPTPRYSSSRGRRDACRATCRRAPAA